MPSNPKIGYYYRGRYFLENKKSSASCSTCGTKEKLGFYEKVKYGVRPVSIDFTWPLGKLESTIRQCEVMCGTCYREYRKNAEAYKTKS